MRDRNDVTAGREVPEQRRILAVLVFAQILSGAGLAAGITVGALLAEEMLGSTGLAGVPSALFTAGAALGALGIGQICRRYGRRPGLALGYAVGALGSLGVVVSAAVGSAVLLFLALLVYGAGTATGLMARYAGADLASPERRGRAVSMVLFATTLGAVVGPNLVTLTGEVAHSWGIPRLAGPFLLAVAAFGAAAVALAALLRPDPLRLAEKLAAAQGAVAAGSPADDAADRPEPRLNRREVVIGTSVMVLTQLVMIAIMTMTPVHMQAHGHGTQAAGLVIALHVGAMFLPSPLTGLLVDRLGRRWIAGASGLTLAVAGLLAALAPPHSVPALATALVLLGIGWNFGLVSGTAIVTDALPPARRASAQGLVDVGIALAGAAGGMSSGLVVVVGGYPTLALAGGVLALAVVPVVAWSVRRPAHIDTAPASSHAEPEPK
ncbi:MFS transporter [Streptomyces sp. Je 1-4]|uniref:MFS transporter n=1 Tax=Streptomyces TaxID=1883 RepID=UPI00140EB442|nr:MULTISPECIES: MFS transporter [unclassified Streptomyces]QIK10294.1 MFS transporter [Streptomyces sp. ID38640]UYB44069.1 MFS transporter [Streptomyces sp. Je 1-4]UZQ40504.1 MFS transporter [Streptomyces sp. Je 1-4] [Streptomyces sp. Je 1-4 4N24]UZQ47921.1 MFS transporter [Streptomyces sp. Je 1-4] [Streptomyces sp. Je 1-4 4N24_ara]